MNTINTTNTANKNQELDQASVNLLKNKTLFFIGIAGVGMSALAKASSILGAHVYGSDIVPSQYSDDLEKIGCNIFASHSASNILSLGRPIDYIVTTNSIALTNPEIQEAKKQNIPIIKRAQLLDLITRASPSVAVAGTHGKTTTSSILSHVLHQLDKDSSFLIGGTVKSLSTNCMYNINTSLLVFEADESDGTLALYYPAAGILTNIELDHVEYYKNFDELLSVYKKFASHVNFLFTTLEEKEKYKFLKDAISVSIFNKNANYYADEIIFSETGLRFNLHINNNDNSHTGSELIYQTPLIQTFGKYNLENILLAIAYLHYMDFEIPYIFQALSSFTGVKRRFENLFHYKNFSIYDDYAHHPTEILSIYNMLSSHFAKKTKIAFFEPHRIKRLLYFKEDFVRVLNNFDEVYIFDCFEISREAKDIKQIFSNSSKYYFVKFHEISSIIEKYYHENVIICSLNAGNLSKELNEVIGIRP